MKNKKGFTLIELLAVIVILGILMMAAIPAITRTIAKSRRNTYWQNAKQYIKAATTPYLDGEYASGGDVCNLPGQNSFVLIPQSIVELEQGDIKKSSFNAKYKTDGAGVPYIMVANIPIETGKDNLQWFYTGMDEQKNGIKNFVNMNELNLKSVTTGTESTINASSAKVICVKYVDGKYKVNTVSASDSQSCDDGETKLTHFATCSNN